MYVISVNVGKAQPIKNAKASGVSGIFKIPASGPVTVTRAGLTGDTICDTDNHGGEDQAVYVFGTKDYAHWSSVLGRDLPPGTFGENLTLSGLESAPMHIGDVLCMGAVKLQVTAPRIPCVTLAARMGDPEFVKLFRTVERPGLYCRVLVDGQVHAGQTVTVERYQGEIVSALEMFRNFYESQPDMVTLQRFLRAPIAIRARQDTQQQLESLRQHASSA